MEMSGSEGSEIGEIETGADATLRIQTKRLEMIAATPALIRSELTDRRLFSRMLRALVPKDWPPELYDEEAARWTLNYLEQRPERVGWGLWYCVLVAAPVVTQGQRRVLMGIAGYKGTPTAEGQVEIGYGVLKGYRRAAYATEAARALVERAFDYPEVRSVIAETFPEIIASIGVLGKNGFVLIGPGSEEGVIRFELTRSKFERQVQSSSS